MPAVGLHSVGPRVVISIGTRRGSAAGGRPPGPRRRRPGPLHIWREPGRPVEIGIVGSAGRRSLSDAKARRRAAGVGCRVSPCKPMAGFGCPFTSRQASGRPGPVSARVPCVNRGGRSRPAPVILSSVSGCRAVCRWCGRTCRPAVSLRAGVLQNPPRAGAPGRRPTRRAADQASGQALGSWPGGQASSWPGSPWPGSGCARRSSYAAGKQPAKPQQGLGAGMTHADIKLDGLRGSSPPPSPTTHPAAAE